MSHVGHAVPHLRDHDDDRSAALLLHPLQIDLACKQKAAAEIGAQHTVPAFRRYRLKRCKELSAGVVDEKIQPAEIAERRAHHLADLLFLADIGGVNPRAAAGLGNFTRHRLELFGSAADQPDAGAERGELMRRAAADAAAASGNKSRLSRQKAVAKHRLETT